MAVRALHLNSVDIQAGCCLLEAVTSKITHRTVVLTGTLTVGSVSIVDLAVLSNVKEIPSLVGITVLHHSSSIVAWPMATRILVSRRNSHRQAVSATFRSASSVVSTTILTMASVSFYSTIPLRTLVSIVNPALRVLRTSAAVRRTSS